MPARTASGGYFSTTMSTSKISSGEEKNLDAQRNIVHLSDIVRRPLLDSAGERIGRIEDLVVRLGERDHPPIGGAVVRIGQRDLFVPIHKISGLDSGHLVFEGNRVDLRKFERRPGELLLARDLRARHLINLVRGSLIRANDIELTNTSDAWQVIGVDPSARSVFRRLLPLASKRRSRGETVVDWGSIEPFVAHVPSARLRIPYRKLARLHPAQIADLVEAASHDEGEEIIEAVGADRELEADVFEELDIEHQVEFVRTRSDAEAARLLGSMAPDDAADLIMEVDQDRRLPILTLLPDAQKLKIKSLLTYNPETAGGLMVPDFLSLPEQTRISDVLEAVRKANVPDEALNAVFATRSDGSSAGSASIVALIKADPSATLGSVVRRDPAHIHAGWDIGATVRKMSDFNLTVAPVMDDEHNQVIGVVTVDDILEQMLPTGWRRNFGTTSTED